MLIDSFSDFNSIFISLIAGFLLSLIYTFFKSYRCVCKCQKKSIFFQDILFSIIASLLTFLILLVRVKGEIRWFIQFFEFLGFFLTKRFLLNHLEKIIIKTFNLIKFNLIKPIISIYKFVILKLNNFIDNFIIKISKKTWKISCTIV